MAHAIAARTASRTSERWADTVGRRARPRGPMTAQAYLNGYGIPQVMPFPESLGTPHKCAQHVDDSQDKQAKGAARPRPPLVSFKPL